jgi:hypothetical protein
MKKQQFGMDGLRVIGTSGDRDIGKEKQKGLNATETHLRKLSRGDVT